MIDDLPTDVGHVEFVSLYLSPAYQLVRPNEYKWRHDPKPEMQEWLEEHIGAGAYGLEWLANLDNDKYEWGWGGLVDNTGDGVARIMFKDSGKAMLFKLVWGGS